MLSCLFFPISAPVSGRLWLDLDSASPPWSLGSTLWLHPIPQSAVQELFSFQSSQQPNCLCHRCGVNIFRVWVNPILSLLSDCFSSCTRVWFFLPWSWHCSAKCSDISASLTSRPWLLSSVFPPHSLIHTVIGFSTDVVQLNLFLRRFICECMGRSLLSLFHRYAHGSWKT